MLKGDNLHRRIYSLVFLLGQSYLGDELQLVYEDDVHLHNVDNDDGGDGMEAQIQDSMDIHPSPSRSSSPNKGHNLHPNPNHTKSNEGSRTTKNSEVLTNRNTNYK